MADTEIDTAQLGFATTMEKLGGRTRELEGLANGFARAMTAAFARSATGGKQFDEVLKSLALRLSDLSLNLALKPVTQGLASGIQGLLGGLTGDVKAFAAGGVIAAPTYFPLGARGIALAGEAGPEAILPLARGADGRLGVAASGAGAGTAPATVTIHIATPDAASFRGAEAYVTGLIARAVARGQRGL